MIHTIKNLIYIQTSTGSNQNDQIAEKITIKPKRFLIYTVLGDHRSRETFLAMPDARPNQIIAMSQ